jgi:alkaline phosphatase
VVNYIKLALYTSVFLLTSCMGIKTATKSNADGSGAQAKNTILVIVDGMGFEHVKAARIYNGQKPFNYEQFTCKSKVTTCPYEGTNAQGVCLADSKHITDSAAAATAMATGIKVSNGAISRALPNYPGDLETIVEYSKRVGKSTGIVATKLFTDATPAAFVAHADGRDNTEEILRDMFYGTKPNLVLGADTPQHRQIAINSKSPYRMVHSGVDLKSLASDINHGKSCSGSRCPYIYGGFGQYDMIPDVYHNKSGLPLEITPAKKIDELGTPHLSEMTDAALKILGKNDQGFFLMVESSMPDMISHYNSQIDANPKSPKAIEVLIREMLELEKTVEVIENFVKNNPNTLVVLTADHETGGLVIEDNQTTCLGQEACVAKVRWTSPKYENKPDSAAQHTAADVPLYAHGQGAERFCEEQINNIDIHRLMLGK